MARTCSYPAQVLTLTNWKETLPIGSAGSPTEIKQPDLGHYSKSPYFTADTRCAYVTFQAPVNGVTTPGSAYPRSELREMTNNGRDEESFSSTIGKHVFTFNEAFTHLPNTKPHLVGGQVRGNNADVTVFRLEGTNLYVTNGDTTHYKLVTNNYRLGTRFDGRFEVNNGLISVYYNGTLQTTIPAVFTGGYFKLGAYTQANCTNSSPCSSSNYGATQVYGMSVTHTMTTMQRMLNGFVNLF
jgi:hypothetical protein